MNATENTNHYAYRIQWSPEDAEYVGTVLEIPGLNWLDATPNGALDGIRKVTQECVDDMLKHGEQPPQAFADHHYSGRFNVRIPPQTHRRIAMEAAEEGVSLNRFISDRLANA